MNCLEQAIAAIDALNAQDPRQDSYEPDQTFESAYSQRMTRWLNRLEPKASEALQEWTANMKNKEGKEIDIDMNEEVADSSSNTTVKKTVEAAILFLREKVQQKSKPTYGAAEAQPRVPASPF